MSAGTAYHDNLGDYFATNADTSPHNAYTDRPAGSHSRETCAH
jgi:hypothetical protein